MPRYYFDVYNDDVTLDEEGAEFADGYAARDHAIKEARVLAADSVLRGHLIANHHIEIVDSNRISLGTVRFGEAVDIRS